MPQHLLLGVSASVAIHRALDLASEARKRGHQVSVAMTERATRLISPLQFQAIAGRRVHHDLFAGTGDDVYDHLAPAREATLLLCAPASADLIARLAHGLADDVLTTCALAYSGPRFFAPAMNWRMWANPIVQRNAATLVRDGWKQLGPDAGDLACGEQGPGRLSPVSDLLAAAGL